MTPIDAQVTRKITEALAELAGQFTVKTRACHFAAGPLARAATVTTIRAARPCADLDGAHRAVAGLPGMVYLTVNGPEVWAYLSGEGARA